MLSWPRNVIGWGCYFEELSSSDQGEAGSLVVEGNLQLLSW